MNKDQILFQWYKDKLLEYIAKGYALKLTWKEAEKIDERTWYLTHFAVNNINKNKLRLVFDAAATEGTSPNSCLTKGPGSYQPTV